MGFMDKAKKKFENTKDKGKDMKDATEDKIDDLDDAFHEKKGKMEGRMDQADSDMMDDEEYDEDVDEANRL